jgi:hypothetical protein
MLDDNSSDVADADDAEPAGTAGRAFKVVQPKSIKPTSEVDETEESVKTRSFNEVQQGPQQNLTQEGPRGPGSSVASDESSNVTAGMKSTGAAGVQGPATLGSGFGGGESETQRDSVSQRATSQSALAARSNVAGKDHETEHSNRKPSSSETPNIENSEALRGSEVEVESQALARAIKKALHEVCRENNHQTRYLVRATAIGVIPYRSGRQQGYIAVAWADPTYKGRSGFLEALRFSLIDFLPIEGVNADLDGEFVMDLDDVDFLKLAKSRAMGLYIQEHEGLEVGVAFFPTQERRAREKVSIDQMVPIRVDDLSPDDPVSFNTYLKMELNKKYVLYLTEGRRILKAQQERLKKNKVPGLHIGENDFEKFVKYLHEVEVRNLVRKFSAESVGAKSA